MELRETGRKILLVFITFLMVLASFNIVDVRAEEDSQDVDGVEDVIEDEELNEPVIMSITDASISLSGTSFEYTGSNIKPEVTVVYGDTTLTKDTDYEVSYSNNKNVGTATATVTGIGDYSDSVELEFKITAKSIKNATISSISDQAYTTKAIKPTPTVKVDGTKLVKGTDYTLSYSSNTKVGKATVTVTGCGNYTGTAKTTFKIVAKSVKKLTINSIANKAYTGKTIKPSVTVKNGSVKLTKDKDYTVSYSNNKSTGKATVTIKAKSSNYTGSTKVYFYIVPKKVTISSVSKDSTKLTVKFKKATGATGYQVAYRKKGTSTWKTKTVTSSKSTISKSITGLKSNTTYQIKVRAYKTVSGKKYYGSYSSTKSVKTLTSRSAKEQKLVSAAKSKLGCKYVYGATGPNTFDCSGFTRWCYKQIGINLAHNSSAQKKNGKVVSIKNLKVGDIVWRSGHVGLYVGNGKVIHSPSPGKRVCYTKASSFKCGVRYF